MTGERDDLAASGYAWEIADAPVLHDALNLADLEHALELRAIEALTDTDGVTLIRGLLMLHSTPCEEVGYDPSHGELVTSREAYLADKIGEVAGYLRAGRTRREAVRTAFRIVVRRQVLDLVVDACELAIIVCDRSEEHARTLMPDYTYLQPAQASTFGHYLLSFADPVLRDAQRLMAEYTNVNQSPAGSGAANGSPLIKDREGAAEALGFSAPAEHIRDAMWQTDPFSHVLFLATSLVLAEDRLAEDLEIFASREFDFVALADNVVRPSVLMPQKRNPYALTVVRGSAGIMIGRLTGQLALAKAPSARSDTFIYAYGEVPRALDLAGRVTRLLGSVIAGLTVNEARMSTALDGGRTEAADLATVVMRRCELDYHRAHDVVAQAIARTKDGAGIADGLAESLINIGIDPMLITASDMAAVLDPAALVESRDSLGGSAYASIMSMSAGRRAIADLLRGQALAERARIEERELSVVERARQAS
ncbi:MAG: argininosuccinate lyase, partial [Actinobacteria bacterium]|nr:argininosuccinate lyase [Actinomycetota bacterium]